MWGYTRAHPHPASTESAITVQPAWFSELIHQEPNVRSIKVAGVDCSYRHWENTGQPGLLFVHGHAAHAHWWDFIAPAFTRDYNVVAVDLSGSGDSGHRAQYTARLFAEELVHCVEDAGLMETVIVGHSFGGAMTRVAAHLFPTTFAGIVLVDSFVPFRKGDRKPPPMPRAKTRVYPSQQEAKRRFRLRPPQPCNNDFIINYIAGHSVRETPQGWMFKLDSAVFAKMPADDDLPVASEMIRGLKIPVGVIYGEQSRFFPPEALELISQLVDPALIRGVADAHHHVFLDQPVKFIETLDQLLRDLRPA